MEKEHDMMNLRTYVDPTSVDIVDLVAGGVPPAPGSGDGVEVGVVHRELGVVPGGVGSREA